MTNTKTNIFDVIPAIEDDIVISVRNGITTLSFLSLRKRNVLSRLLRRFSKTTSIELDEKGAAIISLINGQNKVVDIIDEIQKRFVPEEQMKERTIMYIVELKRRSIIKYLATV